jgi:hypothetical protein
MLLALLGKAVVVDDDVDVVLPSLQGTEDLFNFRLILWTVYYFNTTSSPIYVVFNNCKQ